MRREVMIATALLVLQCAWHTDGIVARVEVVGSVPRRIADARGTPFEVFAMRVAIEQAELVPCPLSAALRGLGPQPAQAHDLQATGALVIDLAVPDHSAASMELVALPGRYCAVRIVLSSLELEGNRTSLHIDHASVAREFALEPVILDADRRNVSLSLRFDGTDTLSDIDPSAPVSMTAMQHVLERLLEDARLETR